MQLLFYSHGVDKNSDRLQAAVHRVIPEGRIEHFKKLEDFEAGIRRPVEPDSVAVLLASTRDELEKMRQLRRLLTEIYVVLVLPDLGKDTIKIAHQLLPRFLSQKDSDFADLKVVLSRMYANSQKSRERELYKEL
jgi:hypothetical protein